MQDRGGGLHWQLIQTALRLPTTIFMQGPIPNGMKKNVVYLLGLSIPFVSLGQNLVPNPSFEVYSACPDSWNQTERAVGWSRYRGSPDYFNGCDAGGLAGVPENVVGYQHAATGQAYVGGYLWCSSPTNTREHLGAMLTEPLIQGAPVYISFKVSPAVGGFLEDMRWAAPRAGLRFTMNPYLQNGLAILPDTAALFMSSAPVDTSTWYTVSGMYVPDSAYQYVVLGNFFRDSLVSPVVLDPTGAIDCAYVYYDDICVSQFPEDCGFVVGDDEHNRALGIFAYPLPAADKCTVVFDRAHAEPIELGLHDHLGRIVWGGKLGIGLRTVIIPLSDVPAGIFILRASIESSLVAVVRILHVEP